MNLRASLRLASNLWLVILLLSACGSSVPSSATSARSPSAPAEPPTPTPTATAAPAATASATATEVDSRPIWDYVVLGDSNPGGYGVGGHSYASYYAAYLEEDLGMRVAVDNRAVNGFTSGDLLKQLRTSTAVRKAIAKAEVITFAVAGNDFSDAIQSYQRNTCGGTDNEDCLKQAQASFEANFDAIVDEILTLGSSHAFIIRTANEYFPFVSDFRATGHYAGLKPYIVATNEYIRTTAETHGIIMADVFHALNGDSGDKNPATTGYLQPDGIHLSLEGHQLVAGLLRELGYPEVQPVP